MSKNFKKHPVFSNKDQIINICAPLKKLDITYFCHVNINEKGQFSGLSNNPEFADHYVKNKYYNADIHLSAHELGGYIIWDGLPKCGETERMDQEAQQFGVCHSFTIVKENERTSDYYHFATHLNHDWFNQVYLANLDLLERFSEYFKETVLQSKMLSVAYDYTFTPSKEKSKFCLQGLDEFLNLEERRLAVKNSIGDNTAKIIGQAVIHKETGKILTFAPQQMRCLALLLSGKSSKEIGLALDLSYRSVEHYVERIRKILGCKNSKEVMATYSIFCGEVEI